MSNVFISELQARTSAERDRLARSAAHPSGGIRRIFHLVSKKKESAEEQIGRLQREVAADLAAAESVKRAHDHLLAAIRETREGIRNASERIAILQEKRADPAQRLLHKVTTENQANSDVLRLSGEVAAIDTAIAHCRAILKELQAGLPAQEAALNDFERKHQDDLAAVEN